MASTYISLPAVTSLTVPTDSVKITDGTNLLDVNADGSIQVQVASTVQYKVLLDDDGAGTIFIGEAQPGTLTSAASWRIKKIVESGAITTIGWADGNSNFDNIWNSRASLTYT